MRAQVVALLFSVVLAACAPLSPPGSPASPGGESRPEARKTITLGAMVSIKTFGGWTVGTTRGGSPALAGVYANGLATRDGQGNLMAGLAERLPSLDDGTIVVLPDGRMQTRWALRSNVLWHDGTPFRAEDVAFGWQVATDPEIPWQQSTPLRSIERIEAPDPSTALITWKSTFYRPLDLGVSAFLPLPRHLLSEPLAGDKQVFMGLPYWSTDFVHLGPFRLVDFGLGDRMVFDRFDPYYLGRPKVDTIVIQIIPDEQALYASLLAGAVDITSELTLPIDLMAGLRDQWRQTGEGSVYQRQGNWRFISVQFNPEWGRPRELREDVRARRGLYLGVDQEAIREVMLPGFSDADGGSFIPRGDPRGAVVGQPFARYRYEPSAASRELAAAGWRRGADGRLVGAAGEPVAISVRTTGGYDRELAILGQNWRDLGVDAAEEIVPAALVRDNEYRAKFPGVEITQQGFGDANLRRFDSRVHPSAQNRWTGNNAGYYTNPALDRLADRLYSTIDERQQGLVLKELSELLAEDLPALPIYNNINLVAVRKGVRALADDYPGTSDPALLSRNAHLWERD